MTAEEMRARNHRLDELGVERRYCEECGALISDHYTDDQIELAELRDQRAAERKEG
jgi:hypothetical protein